MREIIISRPNRFECAAVALKVEVNGKHLAKLRNGKRIVMNVDESLQVIRVHGGFFSGKRFQDTIKIPAGGYSYPLQVDFVSARGTNYLPVLRPYGGYHEKDDNRVTTIMGSTLCKFLLEESLRAALRSIPGASIKVMMLADEWRVLLWYDGGGKILLRSEYYKQTDGFSNALITAIERQQLSTKEGREAVLDRVMTDYVGYLPEYARDGKYGIVLKK